MGVTPRIRTSIKVRQRGWSSVNSPAYNIMSVYGQKWVEPYRVGYKLRRCNVTSVNTQPATITKPPSTMCSLTWV